MNYKLSAKQRFHTDTFALNYILDIPPNPERLPRRAPDESWREVWQRSTGFFRTTLFDQISVTRCYGHESKSVSKYIVTTFLIFIRVAMMSLVRDVRDVTSVVKADGVEGKPRHPDQTV